MPAPLRHIACVAFRGCRARPNLRRPVEIVSAIHSEETLPVADFFPPTRCVPGPFWLSGRHDAATVSGGSVGSVMIGWSWCTTTHPNLEHLRWKAIHPTWPKETLPGGAPDEWPHVLYLSRASMMPSLDR